MPRAARRSLCGEVAFARLIEKRSCGAGGARSIAHETGGLHENVDLAGHLYVGVGEHARTAVRQPAYSAVVSARALTASPETSSTVYWTPVLSDR